MGFDLVAGAVPGLSAAKVQGQTVDLGPSKAPTAATEGQASRFLQSLERAGGVSSTELPKPVGELFRALDGINVQARSVSDYARTAEASGGQLTPGEIVQLTMKCQEFMFQCQLTSNIANRSSDGVQQLFKQQG